MADPRAQTLSRSLFFLPCRQRCSVKSSDPDRTKIYYGNATTGRKCAFGAMKGTCVLLLLCEYERSTMPRTYLKCIEFVDPPPPAGFSLSAFINYIGTTSDSNFDPRFELRALVCLQNPRGYAYEI